MADYIEELAEQVRADAVTLSPALDHALAALDAEMEQLCADLQVPYIGPGVGMADMAAEHVYRLVVAEHEWDRVTRAWGLKVCDSLDNCDLRPMWTVQGVGRLRKRQVVRALPAFFEGYARAVKEAGRSDTAAGGRLLAMAERLAGSR